jgi:hypothetical protein
MMRAFIAQNASTAWFARFLIVLFLVMSADAFSQDDNAPSAEELAELEAMASEMNESAIAAAREPGPDYEPRLDPNHPDYMGPDENGEGGYDPRTDPDHPQKSQTDPGEEWNNPRRADGSPHIKQAAGDWEWGELFYGHTYPAQLTVTNDCETKETVTVTVENLPYLTIPKTIEVNAKSTKIIECTITTPPAPDVFLTGHESIPEGGIFVDIKDAKVTFWHPWNPPCNPKRVVYNVTGHIHFAPKADDDEGGPSRLATTDACTVYWNTGEPPANLDEDCTEKIRVLALHYREKILQNYAEADPGSWGWLPSASAIRNMSVSELVAMKNRIDWQIQTSD